MEEIAQSALHLGVDFFLGKADLPEKVPVDGRAPGVVRAGRESVARTHVVGGTGKPGQGG